MNHELRTPLPGPPAAGGLPPRRAPAWRAGGRLGLGLSALLAGCAAPVDPTAVPAGASAAAPVDGPSARLLLRAAVPAQDRFAVFQLADSVHCTGSTLLIAGTPQARPAPATLSAGVLTTLDFVILRGGKPSCGVRWSFTPVAGKTYLLQGLVVGSGCTARLLDASTPDRPSVPPDAALRSSGGQACVPLAQARANAGATSLIQGGQHRGDAVLNPRATAQDLQGLIKP